MNRRLVVVIAVAVAGFGAVYALMAGGESARPAPTVAEAPRLDLDQVLVAGEDLPMGEVVEERALVWRDWPKSAVAEPMITRSAAPNAIDEAKGSMTRTALMRGEPIRRDKLVKGGAGGFLSALLPAGKRAVAIKIDNNGDTAAGGFILPNDRVDVVAIARDDEATKAKGAEIVTARTILANVRVLAIGQTIEEQNGRKVVTGANATLELDPDQVDLIVLAQHAGGEGGLTLALRALADSGGQAQTTGESGAAKGGLTVVRFGDAAQAIR